jgi:hypothetical protein
LRGDAAWATLEGVSLEPERPNVAFQKAYVAPKIDWSPKVILNANAKWGPGGTVDVEVQHAFDRGIATKVLIPAGTALYKFTDWDMLEDTRGVTPWWSPRKAFQWDPGLDFRLELAKQAKQHPSELTRQVAAVRTNWNGLTNILSASLTRDVWGFWGKVGWQPKFGNFPLEHMVKFDKVLTELMKGQQPNRIGLPGMAGQFFIPGMLLHTHICRRRFVNVDQIVSGEAQLD